MMLRSVTSIGVLVLVAVLLAAVVVAVLGGGHFASGSNTATISYPDDIIIQPGGNETATVTASNVGAPGVCAVTVDLTYNPGVKVPTACTPDPGGHFGTNLCNFNIPGTISLTLVETTTPVSGSFPVANITWHAVGEEGECTPVNVIIHQFADCTGTDVAVVDDDGTNCIACTDADGDTVCDGVDNCPNEHNPDQNDTDQDGVGDACDTETCDGEDNDGDGQVDEGFPDTDDDDIADCMDTDDDNDGILDGDDDCDATPAGERPVDANGCSQHQVDQDLDGVCDPGKTSTLCTGSDACANTASGAEVDANGCSQAQVDQDLDGVCNPGKTSTLCTGSDNCPATPNPDQTNTDVIVNPPGDTLGDACDSDDDNDGVSDSTEAFYGSDPLDDGSTPEALGFSASSCQDGVDNDGDTTMDANEADGPDPGSAPDCKEAVTPTPTTSPTPSPTPTATIGPDDDGDGLPNNLDPCPTDDDCDDDGLMDGAASSEDLNNNGVVDPGETDPESWDSDGDGLSDGLEQGLAAPEGDDTNTASPHWQADADPSTKTDPLSADTDGDSVPDGQEDANHNGKMDAGETSASLVAAALAQGWSQTCYAGASAPVDQALGSVASKVSAVYRLGAAQTFDRWFPGRPEVSTIVTLNPYDQLFVLASEAVTWSQQFSGDSHGSAVLAQGWNAVCYGGDTTDMDTATAGISGQISVIYALEAEQSWARYVPGRPEVSDMTQCDRLYALLVLVTKEGGVTWVFNP